MVSEILRPKTLGEAARLASMPDTAMLGGGTWLNAAVAATRDRASTAPPPAPAAARGPLALVSLENLGLDFVEWRNAALRLGAAATFQQVLDAPGVPEAVREGGGGHLVPDAPEHDHRRRRARALPAGLGADPRARGARRPGAGRRDDRPLGIAEYRCARARARSAWSSRSPPPTRTVPARWHRSPARRTADGAS